MNDTPTTDMEINAFASATALDAAEANGVVTDVKHFYFDEDGNRHEYIPDSDGEATREETAFIAETPADHRVDPTNTIH